MQVVFREVNPFDVWIWVEFSNVPSELERQYVEEVFSSWFFLGKLGGFNAENLQIQDAGPELSYFDYQLETTGGNLMAVMHNMGEMEYEGLWGRCWFDLGTSDEIAFDILINALTRFSEEYVALKQIIIGGENSDWPIVDDHTRAQFVYDT